RSTKSCSDRRRRFECSILNCHDYGDLLANCDRIHNQERSRFWYFTRIKYVNDLRFILNPKHIGIEPSATAEVGERFNLRDSPLEAHTLKSLVLRSPQHCSNGN